MSTISHPLQPLADDLWAAERDLRLPGGAIFPLRMTVARLPDRRLALISPIAIDDTLAGALAELGEVGHLIAPSCFHYLHLAASAARFPAAEVLLAPGLAAKQPALAALPGQIELGAELPVALAARFDALPIRGAPRAGEVVLLDRASATLVVTDLVFHITAPRNRRTALMLALVGARRRLAASRLWRRLRRDRTEFTASLERVLAARFDRLVMAHGEIVPAGARDRLAVATAHLRP